MASDRCRYRPTTIGQDNTCTPPDGRKNPMPPLKIWIGVDGMYLVETHDEVRRLKVGTPEKISFVTQATLSIEDASIVIAVLKERFPEIQGPKKDEYLLRHPEPAGCGEGIGLAMRRGHRRRQPEQI
jgi:hypothetical protein